VGPLQSFVRSRAQGRASTHRSLFVTLLATPERGLADEHRARIADADQATLMDALDALLPHKVAPLLAHQLKRHGVLSSLPAAVQERLMHAQQETQSTNMLLFLTAASILRAKKTLVQPPLLLKGILLADSYYPELSTRPMGDIDFVAAPGCFEALRGLAKSMGFYRDPRAINGPHSITFTNDRGVIFDAHICIQEFIGFSWSALSGPCELKRFRGVEAQTLLPDAMLAHLALHMHGHMPEIGLVLLWLLDIAFVLRRHADDIDLARVRALCRNDGAYALLLRTVRLLMQHGEVLPEHLAQPAQRALPLTLASVLRQRRFTPWGLPGARGVARVIAHRLHLKHYARFQEPHASDFVLWPIDALCLRVSPLLVRVP